MEQYAQMRSSGVPWILDIPESWGIRVLFQLADQVKNKNKDLSEQNLLSLSYGRIKRKDINSLLNWMKASSAFGSLKKTCRKNSNKQA